MKQPLLKLHEALIFSIGILLAQVLIDCHFISRDNSFAGIAIGTSCCLLISFIAARERRKGQSV